MISINWLVWGNSKYNSMGFREFDQGMTADQVAQLRRHRDEMYFREKHEREDDYLSILRPRGDILPTKNEKFELWKASRR